MRRGRPLRSLPFRAEIALLAAVSSISTKAKPRGLPVSRSEIILTECTAPYALNRSRTSSSLQLNGRLPTYMDFIIKNHSLEKRPLGHDGADVRHRNQTLTHAGDVTLSTFHNAGDL